MKRGNIGLGSEKSTTINHAICNYEVRYYFEHLAEYMEAWRSKPLKIVLVAALLIWTGNVTIGQIGVSEILGAQLNTIQTAVPFLTIAPDGRSSGMGDVGAASAPDLNSQHWNSGKYAFIEGKGGVAFTYTPWLINLIPDINLAYLTGYYQIDDKSTVSSSLRYFSLGTIPSP